MALRSRERSGYADRRSNDSIWTSGMATLTVRNLDDAIAKQLRIRAAEHGRSAEAADRLAEFREQTGGRGSASSSELLVEVWAARMRQLTGFDA